MNQRLNEYLKAIYCRGLHDGWHKNPEGNWTGGRSEEEIEKELTEITGLGSQWIALKDEKPKEGQLIAYAARSRILPEAPMLYGTIYYPEPPMTDVMDYRMPLNEIKKKED